MRCIGSGSAPAKLLLFGDHAAVYGYPALGIPLPWRVFVSLLPAKSTCWNENCQYTRELNGLLSKLPEIFPEISALPPFSINIQSSIPIGVGFGSSGALCVALARAIFAAVELPENRQEIWKRAHRLESFFHGTPSGVDTGISTWESAGCFKKREEELRGVELPSYENLPLFQTPLIIGALKRSGSTGSLVSSLKARLKQSPQLIEHVKALGEIAKQAPGCLDDPESFGTLANKAQKHFEVLGISSPEWEKVFEIANKYGACGGKLSGAGGGGAYYLVCPDTKRAKKVLKHLFCLDIKFAWIPVNLNQL